MNIYEKLSAITEEISAVAKNLNVGEGRNQYKAVGEADVLAAVKPLEYKHKVYSYPCNRNIVLTDVMTTTSTYNGQTKETNRLFMRIDTTYRFVNIENPEEYIEITTYGDGVDSQDKAPGKAMTYADKYALLKAYKIITGDDPDQKASEEGSFGKGEPKTKQKGVTEKTVLELRDLYKDKDPVLFEQLLAKKSVLSEWEFTEAEARQIIQQLKKKVAEAK